ncbi:MAG: hydrogenase subunit MbhD domain-containing protein [Actinomycetota bacterium]
MIWRLDVLLLLFLIATALAVVRTRDLLAAALIFSGYSLIMCIVWQQLGAPDIALTEAAVGAGVTTVLFIVTISKTTRREE